MRASPLKISVPKARISYMAKHTKYSYEGVVQLISTILEKTLELTLTELAGWINEFVPKRTGQLRDNLLRNIQSSRVKGGILRIIIATSIDYAQKVDEMTTAQVRHANQVRENYVAYTTKKGKQYHPYATAYYYGNYGHITLNDPAAIGGFFGALVEYAKERALFNLAKILYEYKVRG